MYSICVCRRVMRRPLFSPVPFRLPFSFARGLSVLPPLSSSIGSPRPLHDARADAALSRLFSFPPERIRNFAVVAHVDHGKTTLTDAVLRRAGVLRGAGDGPLGTYTDRLAVERERGITVKAQTCSIFVTLPEDGEEYLLNLIDTPGHVDFQYEVSRSLAASEAVLLLVDVAQSIEAQTIHHFHAALDRGMAIIPVLTKLDAVVDEVPVNRTLQELEDSTGLLRREVLCTSAKAQRGVEDLLRAVIERVPAPKGITGLSDVRQLPPAPPGSATRAAMEDALVPFRALIFDSWTNECAGGLNKSSSSSSPSSSSSLSSSPGGSSRSLRNSEESSTVTCLIRVIDGTLTTRTPVHFYHAHICHEVREVGIIHPELRSTAALTTGMVGYVVFSPLRGDAFSVGETLFTLPTRRVTRQAISPIAGFRRVHPVVFAGFYPDEGAYITQLREAVDKLRVNDPAVTIEPLDCPALGAGIQLGFFGMLHMQVFQERLLAEFGQRVLVTPPQVQYKCRETGRGKGTISKSTRNEDITEEDKAKERETVGGKKDEEEEEEDDDDLQALTVHSWRWPHEGVESYFEPYVTATIVTPRDYFSAIDAEAQRRFRGTSVDMRIIDDARITARYKMPLAALVRGFFSVVKSLSHGFASLDYDDISYEEADLVKVDIIVQRSRVSALSLICARHEAADAGRRIVTSLKSNLTRSAVDIPLQALVGSKIVARETVRAYRKDVTAKIHGGDISRKQKKWNDQKKGKERMARRTIGGATLDQSVLAAAMGATSL